LQKRAAVVVDSYNSAITLSVPKTSVVFLLLDIIFDRLSYLINFVNAIYFVMTYFIIRDMHFNYDLFILIFTQNN
jgi:hypothetical protein